MRLLQITALALALLGAGMTLSACNTVEGMGEDIEEGGDAIDDKARETNRYGDGSAR